MKRRTFTKLAGLSAVAISTTGFIRYNRTSSLFVGDCETTTDILGPFYRPNSPERNNLVIKGAPGDLIELSGTVRHRDCETPYENAKVELWHCSANEIYDNESDEYRYRGTTYCDRNGRYKFTTQMPVPYEVGEGVVRPAHFHIMISAPGYQSLITQIYFTGDPYLDKDSSSADPKAKNRILDVNTAGGIKQVHFDCNMNEKLQASFTALDKIVGVYENADNGNKKEFFKKDGLLWMKNEVYGEPFEYVGNNVFEYGGMPGGLYERLKFDWEKGGKVKLTVTALWEEGKEETRIFTKG